MEVEDVRVMRREVTAYSTNVITAGITISLNIDGHGTVKVTGCYSSKASPYFELAEFNSKYLPQVHAAIGAVLEAMEN